jgi:hypothetical protein
MRMLRIEVQNNGVSEMKALLTSVALGMMALSLATAATTVPASAKGCLKGAAVGGAAGHVAGHHGMLGAAAGCAIGHHEANKKTDQDQQKPPQ